MTLLQLCCKTSIKPPPPTPRANQTSRQTHSGIGHSAPTHQGGHVLNRIRRKQAPRSKLRTGLQAEQTRTDGPGAVCVCCWCGRGGRGRGRGTILAGFVPALFVHAFVRAGAMAWQGEAHLPGPHMCRTCVHEPFCCHRSCAGPLQRKPCSREMIIPLRRYMPTRSTPRAGM